MNTGWKKLLENFPWFSGEGKYPISAYSEFMPPPRLGQKPYGNIDFTLFSEKDPYGWNITEMEEEYELRPGLKNLARQIMGALLKLGQGLPSYHIAGLKGQNLINNPYWPRELSLHAGHLEHEHYVVFLPLALSRTQDDKGRVRWTFFGSSEQGPQSAFWKGFYSSSEHDFAQEEFLSFMSRLLSSVYGESVSGAESLRELGFRILPSEINPRFPYWNITLPSWCDAYLVEEDVSFEGIRYLLTFRPFGSLPAEVREKYLSGKLHLLPFPGSLVFWGMPTYLRLQEDLPMAMQIPLLRLVMRHRAYGGIQVPQSGWINEHLPHLPHPEIQKELLLSTYKRTNRWNKVHRYEDELSLLTQENKVTLVLFSTALDSIGLYDKPMARNCQLWTKNFELLLDGLEATQKEIDKAAKALLEGGLFGYRFHFPAMQAGLYEVYWQRPLVAYLAKDTKEITLFPDAPLGYFTAYRTDSIDLAQPVELWPRLLRRNICLFVLRNFEHIHEHYSHQSPMNILSLIENYRLLGEKPLPRSFARHLIKISKQESLEEWLNFLPEKAGNPSEGEQIKKQLETLLEPETPEKELPPDITFEKTGNRSFEEAFWNDIMTLAHGNYINKNNADCVEDPITLSNLSHHRRDLEALGDYLINRHKKSIKESGMEGEAFCGDMPFHWRTDFSFSLFGGWNKNHGGHGYERNILLVIPGKNRNEAVVMADHYDTAYMEDLYEKSRGGLGIRLAAAGADDNHSATATLLLAAPIFLKLAKEGRLERDIWLLHLTGEEFPSDCMGARYFSQAIVEKTLKLRLSPEDHLDLSQTQVAGVFVLDMIAHNRESEQDVFQISPGKSKESLTLAWHAHFANLLWNERAGTWNRTSERRGEGRGRRSHDGKTIPKIALHPHLHGEIRTTYNTHSSLFNTDGQIFSDIGAPVVLFMENYDINRAGYHDTKDTMENIDLDYGAALAAIAVETVARTAMVKDLHGESER